MASVNDEPGNRKEHGRWQTHGDGMRPIDRVLARLPGWTQNGKGYSARCPAHADKTPSLTISEAEDGKVLLHCFPGCKLEAIVTAMGLPMADLFPAKGKPPGIVATYDYQDEQGTLLYQVVRYDPKHFKQRRPDGHGGWIWKMQGVRLVLYSLPAVLAAETIFIVEGEKDVETLGVWGLTATCNPMGAEKWRPEYAEALRGKHVIILPDNDAPGEAHAVHVARSVLPVAASVKVVRLPGLPDKGDVSDWRKQGHSKEELLALVEATPVWTETGKAHTTAVLTRLHEVTPEKVRWLWPARIPLGKLTLLDGDPGLGKSLITLDVAARATRRTSMPDGTMGDLAEPAGVVLVSAEDDPADTIRPRLDAVGADCTKIVKLKAVREKKQEHLPTLGDIAAIREAVAAVSAKLVVVDPLMAHLPGKTDSHRDQDVRSALAPLAALAAETGAAVLIVRHLNKTESGNILYRGGGSIGIIGAARSGLVVAQDPENEEQRVLAATKSNLAKLAPSLSYIIEVVDEVPRIKWGAASTHTASSLLAQQTNNSEERSALDEAQEFLRALLGQGACETKAVLTEARNAGIAEKTLYRAKTALRIRPRHEGNHLSPSQRWMWSLPAVAQGAQASSEDGQATPEDGHTLTLGHLQASTEKNSRNDANLPEDGQDSEYGHLRSTLGHLQSDEPEMKSLDDEEEGEL